MGELGEEGVSDCHVSMCAKSQAMKGCSVLQQYKLFFYYLSLKGMVIGKVCKEGMVRGRQRPQGWAESTWRSLNFT